MSKFCIPTLVYNYAIMKVDNIIHNLSELNPIDFEFDPTYLIVLHTASIVGINFTLKIVVDLMPISMSSSEVLKILLDLCEINIILEFEQGCEFAFESRFIKDVIYNMQLYDSRKRMHRK